MTISVSGTQITFNDSTTQSTASRTGTTAVTLTSASPSSTLTGSSNPLVQISSDATKATRPSIVLPAMNAAPMATGESYFNFCNLSSYNVALKDTGGTVRQYLAPGANNLLNIKDVSTANGVWATAVPVQACLPDSSDTTTFTGWKVNAGQYITASKVVKLSTTVVALVWVEFNGTNTATYYAQPYSINTSTNAVTQGTRITVGTISLTTAVSYGNTAYWNFSYDTDNAGHALVATVVSPSVAGIAGVYGFAVFGLSYSGGALYASALSTTTGTGGGTCSSAPYAAINGIAYLGSNSAYAFIAVRDDGTQTGASTTQYYQGYTVTGTTTVTLTASASNTTLSGYYVSGASYAARTGLTTFTAGWLGFNNNNYGRSLSYTPASNTFTVTARSTSARLDIEQGVTSDSCSFAAGGFMYCSSKVFFKNAAWDITNAGAAGVTTVLSTSVSLKYNYSTGYWTRTGSATGISVLSSIPVSGSSVVGIGSNTVVSCDPSTGAFNFNYSGGGPADIMLDTTLAAVTAITYVGYISTYTGSLSITPANVATVFTN